MTEDSRRMQRVNSLIREAIASVILKEVEHPKISNKSITITRVETSKDLQTARIFVSIMSGENSKEETLEALKSSCGFIACKASKQVNLRYFPNLVFYLDEIFSKQDKIENLLWKIRQEERNNNHEFNIE
ncbi:MAG: 30S ribosome-binding factor RbfA [Victivallaceae bacterium]